MKSLGLNSEVWVAIGAIVTFLMMIATFISLFQSQRQIRLLRKQKEEEQRARISFSIIPSQNIWYLLKISNIGKETAYNIKIKFNESFLDSIHPNHREYFTAYQNNPFALEQGESKYLMISEIKGAAKEWDSKCKEIVIIGEYCDKYKISESMNIIEYMQVGLIHNDTFTTDFQYLKKGIVSQNNQYMTLQRSLDMIAKNIERLAKNSDVTTNALR